MSSELKPCPFCGEAAAGEVVFGAEYVRCQSCGALSSGWCEPKQAVDAWNSRAVPELPEGYRENDEGDLCCGGLLIAFDIDNGAVAIGNDAEVILSKAEVHVLSIWLQRRANGS